MIYLKTPEEIKILRKSGKILRETVDQLRKIIQPGVRTEEIDRIAEKTIKEKDAKPSFKEVKGYYWTICAPVNEEIVHVPPSKRVLNQGDIFTLDIGVYFQGFHTDYAESFFIGDKKNAKKEVLEFLKVGRETLNKAISKFKFNHYLGEVSEAIEKNIYKNGYYVIKALSGHGIGRNLHEETLVLGYLNKPKKETLLIREGLVIAIEVIYSMGTEEMVHDKNNHWIIRTKDNSLSACFEKTVAILNKKTVIIT